MEQIIEKSKNATRNLATRNLATRNLATRNLAIKEGFDGIRKSNSRMIFTILLGIIIIDFAYECMNS